MIDKETFAQGMASLAGAFNKNLDAGVSRAYYVVLNPLLNDAEFMRAIQLCLTQETFWPAPAVLLGKVKAADSANGLHALEHVTRVMSAHGGYRFLPHAVYHAEFDAPTRQAIADVGGLAAIANTHEDRWASMQKKFAAAYAKALLPQLEAPKADEPKVKQLVRDTARSLSLVSKTSGRDRAAGVDREAR